MLTRPGIVTAFVILAVVAVLLGLVTVWRLWRWARPPTVHVDDAVDAAWRDSLPDVAALLPSITCPRCAMTSYNGSDVRYGYCGRCHDFTGPYNKPAPRPAPPPHLGRQLPRHPEEP